MIRILINGQNADILEETFELTKQCNDLNDLSSRQTSFSSSIVLPFTANNNRIFGNSNDITSADTIPYEQITATIEEDGVIFFEGYVYLNKIDEKGYNINIFADNYNFFSLIENLKLSDLDFTGYGVNNELNYLLSTRVRTSGVKFPIVDYSKDGAYMNNSDRVIDVRILRPAIFIKSIFDEIQTKSGWNFAGTILTDERYKRLLLTIGNEATRLNATSLNFYYGSTDDNYSADELIQFQATADTGGLFFDNKVTLTNDGDYTFKLSMDFEINYNDVLPWPQDNYIKVFRNGVYETQFPYTGTSFPDYTVWDLTVSGIAGDYFEFYYSGRRYAMLVRMLIELSSTWIEVKPNIIDMTIKDFMKNIMNLFALSTNADYYSKTLTFYSLNDVYNNKSVALDLSDKLDLSSNSLISLRSENYGTTNIFQYSNDDDTYSYYAQGVINSNSYPTKKTDVINIDFAASYDTNKLVNKVVPLIPYLTLGAVTGETLKPRLLIDNTQATSTVDYSFTDTVNTININTNIPFCYFNNGDYGISFETLVNEYYGQLQYILTDFKKVTCKIKLSNLEFSNLDFSIPIYIEYFGAYFYVNKETYIKGQTAKLELQRL